MKKRSLMILMMAAVLTTAIPACDKVEPENPQEPETEQPVEPEKPGPENPDPEKPEPPVEPEKPVLPPADPKPVMLWIDASANFERLSTKEGIIKVLDQAQEAGFNGFCLDVKPIQGHALYKSGFLKPCTQLHGVTVERDWDYLQFFIDEAKKRKMRVTVSACIMTWGAIEAKLGPAFEDPVLADAACIENLPCGLRSVKDSKDSDVYCFMNPLHPEVRNYVKRMLTELVSNYEFDSFIFDYCRYLNINSDFSDLSRQKFEEYTGKMVQNWPDDIYYYKPGVTNKKDYTTGERFDEWIEFRSHVIQECVTEFAKTIRDIKPDVEVELWGGPWWPLWDTGQNWGSPKTDRTSGYWWATPDYYKTGFADQLDIFQVGAYGFKLDGIAQDIYMAKTVTAGDCKVFGTISAANGWSFKMAEACEMCLKDTDGLMVFELCHIISNEFWDDIRKGVDKAEKDLGIVRK